VIEKVQVRLGHPSQLENFACLSSILTADEEAGPVSYIITISCNACQQDKLLGSTVDGRNPAPGDR